MISFRYPKKTAPSRAAEIVSAAQQIDSETESESESETSSPNKQVLMLSVSCDATFFSNNLAEGFTPQADVCKQSNRKCYRTFETGQWR